MYHSVCDMIVANREEPNHSVKRMVCMYYQHWWYIRYVLDALAGQVSNQEIYPPPSTMRASKILFF